MKLSRPQTTLLRLASLLAGGFLALPTYADVTLQRRPAQFSSPWQQKFADGKVAAAVTITPSDQTVPVDFGSDNFFGQSFRGNDQYLRGVALYGGGLNAKPMEYTISVLDYGPRPPVMTLEDFNPSTAATVMVVGTFNLGSEEPAQIYLSFDGDDTVFLRKDHAYVFMIASTRDSAARFYRTVTDEAYVGGTGAIGPEQLNPRRFAVNGTRDVLFAIYTAKFGE